MNEGIKVEIETLGRKYDFIINGYKVVVAVSIYDTVGMHPLDVLIKDLESVLNAVRGLEKFQSGQQKELPPGEKVTLSDITG